jgi:Alginate export
MAQEARFRGSAERRHARHFLVPLVLLMMLQPGAVWAAADDEASRRYNLLRDRENWSWLREPHAGSDAFDPAKYVRLVDGRDDIYLTLGGEMRQWVEGYRNELWGSTGHESNVYWLQRYMLHADLHVTPWLRLFVQLKSGLEAGRRGGPRLPDKDILDFNALFIDLVAVPGKSLDEEDRLLLRVGRQELSYGSGRLVDVREGPNVRFGFDGVRVIARPGPVRIEAFAVRPDQTNPGALDDGWDPTQVFWGSYNSLVLDGLTVDAYYLGLERDKGVYERAVGHERRHTLGARARIAVADDALEAEAESAYQFGTFLDSPISAWTVAGEIVGKGRNLPLAPTFAGGIGLTSGDRPTAGHLGTFSPLFPRGTYFGLISANGASNNIAPHATVSLALPERVSFTGSFWAFFRQSLGDGIYNVPGFLLRSGSGNDARYLGSQFEGFLSWAADRHLSINATFAQFWVGDFFNTSKPGRDITYGAAWATYKF